MALRPSSRATYDCQLYRKLASGRRDKFKGSHCGGRIAGRVNLLGAGHREGVFLALVRQGQGRLVLRGECEQERAAFP
jgi:hypothetical protein